MDERFPPIRLRLLHLAQVLLRLTAMQGLQGAADNKGRQQQTTKGR